MPINATINAFDFFGFLPLPIDPCGLVLFLLKPGKNRFPLRAFRFSCLCSVGELLKCLFLLFVCEELRDFLKSKIIAFYPFR